MEQYVMQCGIQNVITLSPLNALYLTIQIAHLREMTTKHPYVINIAYSSSTVNQITLSTRAFL